MNINDLLKDKIEELDIRSITKEIISEEVREKVVPILKKHTEEVCKGLIQKECEKFMNGKEIVVSDGWSNTKKYESLEALFKEIMFKKMNESYDIKRELESVLKKEADKFVEQYRKQLICKVIEQVTTPKP